MSWDDSGLLGTDKAFFVRSDEGFLERRGFFDFVSSPKKRSSAAEGDLDFRGFFDLDSSPKERSSAAVGDFVESASIIEDNRFSFDNTEEGAAFSLVWSCLSPASEDSTETSINTMEIKKIGEIIFFKLQKVIEKYCQESVSLRGEVSEVKWSLKSIRMKYNEITKNVKSKQKMKNVVCGNVAILEINILIWDMIR